MIVTVLRRGVCAALLVTLVAAAPAVARDVYVTNLVSNNVSQYDVGLGGALAAKDPATVGAGTNPVGVAVSPDGRSVYVANTGSGGSVSQYDVGPGGALAPKDPATVDAGAFPIGVAVSPDGRSVYVTNFLSDNVSQYDVGPGGALAPKDPATVGAGNTPDGIAVSPDGRSAYAANFNGDDVSQYDVGPNGALAPKDPATVGAGAAPAKVAVSPDGRSFYVGNSNSDNVSQYDIGPGGALAPKDPATVGAGAAPVGVAVSPDGRSAYVADSDSNTVSQYDVGLGGTLAPKDPATVGAAVPFGIALSADGRSAYAANFSSSTVSQYDVGADGTLAAKAPATVGAGTSPYWIAASPDQPPVASFEVSGTPTAGVPASFDASSSTDPDGDIATYEWEFGDGEIGAGGPTTTHTYFEPGTYTARLTLTDDEGCSTNLIFTGQTAYCNGGPGATTTRQVTVEAPDRLTGLELSLAKRLNGNRLRATARCEGADCAARLRGNVRVRIPGSASASGKATASARPLRPRTVELAAGERRTVRLKVRRKASKLRRAVRRGHRVKATVRGRATDSFDNVERARARARLG